MAKKKPAQRHTAKPEGPGLLKRLGPAVAAARSGVGALTEHVSRAMFGLLVIGGAIGWIMGREPLQNAVAQIKASEPQARIEWPRSPGAARDAQTWLPGAIQDDLINQTLAGVSSDPFDRDGLEDARARLEATGWFERLESVRRRPDGVVTVEGKWRVPVAVVRQGGREHLVARGGEILRLPPGVPVAAGSMPVIFGPYALPPTDIHGQVICGKAWPGGDVQDAIALLATLRARPGFERITGVELYDYMKTGHLTLVSDTGARFVWGSPIGRNAPGEAAAERRMANLRSILEERRDAPGYRYEIYTPYVLVDTTMPRE